MAGSGTITIGSGASGGASYTGATTVEQRHADAGWRRHHVHTGNFTLTGQSQNSPYATMNVADSANIATTGSVLLSTFNHSAGIGPVYLNVINNASLSAASLSYGSGVGGPGNNTLGGDVVTVANNASLTISSNLDLYGTTYATATTVLNLNGGTTTVGNFLASSGGATHPSVINFNGGALGAATNDATSGTTFLPALAGLTVNVTNTALPAVIGNAAGFTNTIAAVLANTTANTDGGLVKRGGGTLILSAVNTYYGPTVVSNGTLVVNGSITTNSVLILTNGTLGGSGTVNGVVTNQGTLAPGAITNVAGTVLTLNNNLTLLPGSTSIMQVSHISPTSDRITSSGTIAYGGTLTIVTNAGDATAYQAGDTFTLFSGSISGSFTAIQPSPGPGLVWSNDVNNLGNFIVTAAPTAAGFTGTPTNGLAPLQVVFTDTSTGSITNWAWNFGNGHGVTNTSNANVTNIYAAAGSYTVSLIVTDAGGYTSTNTQTAYIVVTSPVPVANFTGTPTNGAAPLAVTFTNLSSGATNYVWNFGNGTLTTGAGTNVTDTYSNAGSYTVILTAYGTGGTNALTNTAYIVVTNPPPVAGFSGTPTNLFVTQAVVFTNTSTGSITNWAWNFGNGTLSSGAGTNVTDTYSNAGSYTVQLIVSGSGGANTNTQSAYIVVKPVPVLGRPVEVGGTNFIFSGTNGVAGAQYRIVSSTNVAQSLATWPPLVTNTFNSDGSYTFTNTGATNKARFFRLVSP
jgi:PKD repeat protein